MVTAAVATSPEQTARQRMGAAAKHLDLVFMMTYDFHGSWDSKTGHNAPLTQPTGDPGPAGFSGSIVIAEFESLEAARAWADADPYVAAGVYARVDVRPFRRVLP